MITDPNDARAYLAGLSQHQTRPGDTANFHPDFAVKLANAIQQARAQGLPIGVMSGFREPNQTGSAYDAGGNSSHSYGLASDISGLDGPNGNITNQWAKIAGANGLSNPYGVGNAAEFNHWQLPPQPLERSPQLLAKLQAAKGSGNFQNVWNAYSANTGGATTATTGGAPALDNRQLVFNTLQKAGLTPQQAYGALVSLGGESYASLRTDAANPSDPGGAIGMGQWTGGSGRRQQLEAYAHAMGKPVTDPQTQANFMAAELTGGVPGVQQQAGVLDALKATNNWQDAARVWTTKYEVPKNAANEAELRIARANHVGTLDAQGNFTPGDAAPKGGSPATTTTAPGGGTTTPAAPAYVPLTPEQRFNMSIGQTLASLGSSGTFGGGGSVSAGTTMPDPVDEPAIRTPALSEQMAGPSPVPAAFAGGVGSSIGSQLGSLALQPGGDPTGAMLAQNAPSITQGAPSMTAMLGGLGTSDTFNYLDPRRTVSPALTMRQPRLA
jgi:hypothetical protein